MDIGQKSALVLALYFLPLAASADSGVSRLDQQAAELKARYARYADNDVRTYSRGISQRRSLLQKDLQEMSRWRPRGRRGRIAAEDYVRQLRQSTQMQINALQVQQSYYESARMRDARMRAVSIQETADNLKSQMDAPGTSTIRLTPQGTNLYVRNYVNVADQELEPEPIVPLRAVAEKWCPPKNGK